MSKRPIIALALEGAMPATPPTAQPEVTWISPTDLLVDEGYQRDLSPASLKLIRRIVEDWDWRRFKPPVVAWTDDGLEVIDGQHSAIAAATHPAIEKIPVVLVEAAEQVDRAQAFLGHNRDRIAITSAQMHVASAAAGDGDAVLVNRIAAAAGVELLRLPPARAEYRPRSTIALSAVRNLVTGEDETDATYILATLAAADLAPIQAMHIHALRKLLDTEEFGEVDREALARTIQSLPIKQTEQEAKEHAATHAVPVYRGLVAVWFKALKKVPKKKADAPLPPPPAEPPAAPPAPDSIKRDERPGRGGWKAGRHVRRCHNCDERFMGDAAAFACAGCAYGASEREDAA